MKRNVQFSYKPKGLFGLFLAPIVALAAMIPFGFFFLWAFLLISTITGIFLGFKAGLLAGLIILLVEPAPLVIGLVYFIVGTNLAEKFATWLNTVL